MGLRSRLRRRSGKPAKQRGICFAWGRGARRPAAAQGPLHPCPPSRRLSAQPCLSIGPWCGSLAAASTAFLIRALLGCGFTVCTPRTRYSHPLRHPKHTPTRETKNRKYYFHSQSVTVFLSPLSPTLPSRDGNRRDHVATSPCGRPSPGLLTSTHNHISVCKPQRGPHGGPNNTNSPKGHVTGRRGARLV